MMKENLIPYFGDSKGKIGKIKSFSDQSIGRQSGGNYIKNTCLHNKYFDLQYPINGYIGEGSSGVVRRGTYVGKGGSTNYGAFKLFLSPVDKPDLMELKYAIELNKIIPEAVVHIELVKKCDIFSDNTDIASINNSENLIIIGMEIGQNLTTVLEKLIAEQNYEKIETYLTQICDSCNDINKYGYFHRDIKPDNIVIVNRNGLDPKGRPIQSVDIPVLIDFGHMCYMSEIDNVIYDLKKEENILNDLNSNLRNMMVTPVQFKYPEMNFNMDEDINFQIAQHDKKVEIFRKAQQKRADDMLELKNKITDMQRYFSENRKKELISTNLSNEINKNPPLDSFYLSLLLYTHYLSDEKMEEICFALVLKFYKILRILHITDDMIKNINFSCFNNYTGCDYFDFFLDKMRNTPNINFTLSHADHNKYIASRSNLPIPYYRINNVSFESLKSELKKLNVVSSSPRSSPRQSPRSSPRSSPPRPASRQSIASALAASRT